MDIERSARARLNLLMAEFPAVAILGPRQVGKTTLALQRRQTTRGGATWTWRARPTPPGSATRSPSSRRRPTRCW
jgi:hypothetical protein